MGDLEKFIRVILATKQVNQQKIVDLQEVIDTLKLSLASMNSNIKELKQQNSNLQEQLSQMKIQDNTKTTLDKVELESMQEQIGKIQERNSQLEKIASTSSDRLRQADEEIENKAQLVAKYKHQLVEISQKIGLLEAGNEKLKSAYNQLMQKYSNLKSNMKREMERMLKDAQSQKSDSEQEKAELDTNQSTTGVSESGAKAKSFEKLNSIEQLNRENSTGNQSNDEHLVTPSDLQNLRAEHETEKGLLQEKMRELEEDLAERDEVMQQKDFKLAELNRVVKELTEKRQNLLQKLSEYQSSGATVNREKAAAPIQEEVKTKETTGEIAYNINPTKLTQFLDDMERNLKQLYKDFISYSILKEEDKMQEIQLAINMLVEVVNEFMHYSSEKLKYLRNKGIQFKE